MNKTNGVGQERQYWGIIPVIPGNHLIHMAKKMEDVGFEGAQALQIYGPPFSSLAIAAAATERLKVGTGVIVAGTRSPFETAMMAMDMDNISEGRFILGLGTGVNSVNTGLYGLPHYKLVAHLRDTVAAVRHIIAGSHKGLEPYEGSYYKADFNEMITMAPPYREHIPIWIAALRNKLLETTLEIADGLMLHALWSAKYTADRGDEINTILAKYGRSRRDVHINSWPWIAVNKDIKQAVDDSRATVAAYASISVYEPFFKACGFEKEARLCQEGAKMYADSTMYSHNVPDEMVETFVACGDIDAVLERLEPYWQVADSITVMSPYRHLSVEKMQFYGQGLFSLVEEAKK